VKVVIIGAGEVGLNLARYLSRGGKDVEVIEADLHKCAAIDDCLDVDVIRGSGTNPAVLARAGLKSADIFLAVTENDETNLMSVFLASEHLPAHAITMARLRNRVYAQDRALQRRFNLDVVVNPEVVLGRKILRILAIPGAQDVLSFENGKVDLVAFRAREEWDLTGKPLSELANEYAHFNLMVAAILRGVEGALGRQEVVIPRGDTQILPNDLVYFLTQKEFTPNLWKLGVTEGRPGKSVLLAGGGELSMHLAEMLSEAGYVTRLMIEDEGTARRASERLSKAIVLHADPADMDTLTGIFDEGVDTYIAATLNEAVNIVTCAFAGKVGVARPILVTHKPEMKKLVQAVGAGGITLNPFDLAAAFVLRNVHQVKVLEAKLLAGEGAEAFEFVPPEDSPILNVPLREVRFPMGSLVAMIVRDEQVVIPRGEDVIQRNDRVIVLCKSDSVNALEKLLKPGFWG